MTIALAIIAAAIGIRLLARRGVHPVLDKDLAPPGSDVLDFSGRRPW